MEIPSAEFIEGANESVAQLKPAQLADELREFRAAIPNATADMEKGYVLGLQTARVILLTHPTLMLKGINPGDLL